MRVPWQEAEKLTTFHASAPGYEQAFGVGEIRLRRSMRVRGVVVDSSGGDFTLRAVRREPAAASA